MMPVPSSYKEDSSVKMAESASLLPGNLAVQLQDGSSVAYALVSRDVAAITRISPNTAAPPAGSATVGFDGPPEDASSRYLTGVGARLLEKGHPPFYRPHTHRWSGVD